MATAWPMGRGAGTPGRKQDIRRTAHIRNCAVTRREHLAGFGVSRLGRSAWLDRKPVNVRRNRMGLQITTAGVPDAAPTGAERVR